MPLSTTPSPVQSRPSHSFRASAAAPARFAAWQFQELREPFLSIPSQPCSSSSCAWQSQPACYSCPKMRVTFRLYGVIKTFGFIFGSQSCCECSFDSSPPSQSYVNLRSRLSSSQNTDDLLGRSNEACDRAYAGTSIYFQSAR